MNYLETLREAPPRDPAVVRSLTHRFLHPLGFVAYALVYGFLSLMAAAGLSIWLTASFSKATAPQLYQVLNYAPLALFVLSWIPFAKWVKGRRYPFQILVREGLLEEATILHERQYQARGATITQVTVEVTVEGMRREAQVRHGGAKSLSGPKGSTCPVLVHRDSPWCVVFLTQESSFSAKFLS